MKKIEKKIKTTEQQRKELIDAIRINDIETIKRIIKEGINVNIRDGEGWTALHYACNWGYIETVKFLIDNGADVNAKNENFRTPLHVACSYGDIDVVCFLIENGVDIMPKDKHGHTPLDDLKRTYPQKYQKLMEWITEKYPEKLLEYMASESVQSKGVGL